MECRVFIATLINLSANLVRPKVVKTIGVLSVASLMSTSAFSQISISGYAEVGFMTGSTNGTRSIRNEYGEVKITVDHASKRTKMLFFAKPTQFACTTLSISPLWK